MSTVTTEDGSQMFYKDWGSGPSIVFSQGLSSTADAWENQMFRRASHGDRWITHDRCDHGQSSQSWNGNDLDTIRDDLAALTAHLYLKKAIYVGSESSALREWLS